MEQFELIVIGGGPGGYLCAERAASAGLSVALFEKCALGGTCLNEGCVPTKAMLNSAKLYRHAMDAQVFGVTVDRAKLNHQQVIGHKDQVVNTLVSGIKGKMKRNHVNVIQGDAKIVRRENAGFVVEADKQTYIGRRLVVASGSETALPPIPGLKEGLNTGFVVTNREALALKQLPETMVVMGGGVIGLEMASYFASAGVRVVVIEMMPKIAGATDPEICDLLMKECGAFGIEFKLSTKILAIRDGEVTYEENGEVKSLICNMVLLAAGRRPATAKLGLENIGVAMNGAAVQTDKHLQTNIPGVYAIGDCNGISMLAHTAYREAEVAVNHMLGREDEIRYEVIPSVIYTDPEVACVGETKESAQAKGMDVKEVKLPLLYSGRYVAENENGKGILKLVIDVQRNRLVGVHIFGTYASEIIASAAMMLDTELPPERLKKMVFPHPTVGEVLHEALYLI